MRERRQGGESLPVRLAGIAGPECKPERRVRVAGIKRRKVYAEVGDGRADKACVPPITTRKAEKMLLSRALHRLQRVATQHLFIAGQMETAGEAAYTATRVEHAVDALHGAKREYTQVFDACADEFCGLVRY